MLDSVRAIESPEGVHLELRPAGPVVRCMAYLVDLLIRIIVYILIGQVLPLFGRVGDAAFLIVVFGLEWLYFVPFEVVLNGATPGKWVMKIRVVQDDGVPVGWSASVLRNLLRAVDFLPFAYGFGIASMLLHRDFRRLGDLAAGTLVVHDDRRALAEIPPVIEKTVPPVRALSLDERRAVTAFAERMTSLTPERTAELADLAEPITGIRGAEGAARLVAIAAWLRDSA